MTGLYVSVPVACFRKGLAREYLETENLPPPSTCYGFLLSLVGETQRSSHLGARVTVAYGPTLKSTVLRTVWRIKDGKRPPGQGNNARPDYQQLLTGIELIVWLDSLEETRPLEQRLETRVAAALDPEQRGNITRFGGLSFGESTHLVDEVSPYIPGKSKRSFDWSAWHIFLLNETGLVSLPIWVDHVGSANTRHVTGDLDPFDGNSPVLSRIPMITSPLI